MFGNFVLSSMLVISFGLLMVLLLTAAGVDFQSILGIAKKTDNAGRRVGHRADGNAAANALNARLLQSVHLMRDALLLIGDDRVKAQIASLRKTQMERNKYLDSLERSAIAARGRNLMAAISLANRVFIASEDECIRLVEANQMKEAKVELLSRACPALSSYIEAVNALIQFQGAKATGESAAHLPSKR